MHDISAQRVLSRFLCGAVADPEGLARTLRHNLDVFDELVPKARALQDALADIKQLVARKELSDLDAWHRVQALTDRSSGYGAILLAIHREYVEAFHGMWVLALAVLQKYSLPQALRKKVEVIARFWSTKQTPRKPKLPNGNIVHEDAAVSLYLRYVEDTRTQLGTITEAMTKGRPISEGDATDPAKVKAGPFTLLNTGGFPDDLMQSSAEAMKKAADLATARGFGSICYGEVNITQKIGARNTLAFYMIQKDEMFLRADAEISKDHIYNILHELGHRYEHKFLKRHQAPDEMYLLIGRKHTKEFHREKPQKGEVLTDPKSGVVYEVVSVAGDTVHLRREPDPLTLAQLRSKVITSLLEYQPDLKQADKAKFDALVDVALQEFVQRAGVGSATVHLQGYYAMKGIDPRKRPDFMGYITPYAAQSASENFSEMFAHYCMGTLPKGQVELFEDRVLSSNPRDVREWIT